jgi:alcohol dehydrogenase class IV
MPPSVPNVTEQTKEVQKKLPLPMVVVPTTIGKGFLVFLAL